MKTKPFLYLINNDLEETVKEFISSCNNLRETSKLNYKMSIRQFLNWALKQRITNPTHEDIQMYKLYLEETKGLALFTVSTYINTVRVFFSWLAEKGYYLNVAKNVFGDKYYNDRYYKDPLTLKQIRKLLKSVDMDSIKGLRDYAIINLMIKTGLRVAEVAKADVGDIKRNGNGFVLWVLGKGRSHKDRNVILTKSTYKPIEQYLKARMAIGAVTIINDPLFASLSDKNRGQRMKPSAISRIVKQQLKKIGLNNRRYSAHSLRHTSITLAMKAGATLEETAKMARHENINTTLVYAHIDNSKNNISAEHRIDSILAGLN